MSYRPTRYYANEYDSYRIDYSGYVSMARALDPSHTTQTLPVVSHPIAKSSLQPGGIFLNNGSNASLRSG